MRTATDIYLNITGKESITGNVTFQQNVSLGKSLILGFGEYMINKVNGWIHVYAKTNLTDDVYIDGDLYFKTGYGFAKSRKVETIILTPEEADLPATNPVTFVNDRSGTNFPYDYLNFTDAATNDAFWTFAVPDSYDGSNINVTMYYLLNSTTNANIFDALAGLNRSNNDIHDVAFNTITSSSAKTYGSASHSSGDLFIAEYSWSSNLPSSRDLEIIRYRRLGGNAGDTVNEEVKLLMIKFEFNGDI